MDTDSDLLGLAADCLPFDQPMPFDQLLDEFVAACEAAGIERHRYQGRAASVLRRLLETLQRRNRASRQPNGNGWGGPHYREGARA